ncbi:MAG: formimidoylglutamase [bacterium]
MKKNKYYKPPDPSLWKGRIDDMDDRDSFRWHQVIEFINLTDKQTDKVPHGYCFLGYSCDTGVRKNKGRTGTAHGPDSIRREMANLPCYFDENTHLYDAGNILCPRQNLAQSHEYLTEAVDTLHSWNLFPLVIGGGHDLVVGHFRGLLNGKRRLAPESKKHIGIINFDAHFDLRAYHNTGGNSGTGFLQIADICKKKNEIFSYLCIGIQQYGNTLSLFEKAEELGAQYIMAKNLTMDTLAKNQETVDTFIYQHDYIYLTICSDVLSAAYAPGVSAPQPFGLHPEIVITLVKHILLSGKVLGMDIAEVSPRFDTDNRTAQLAAILFFAALNIFSKK